MTRFHRESAASVNDPRFDQDDWIDEPPEEGSSIATTIVLALALLLLVAAFVWFMIRLDPLLSDFIEQDGPTPTVTSPTDGT